jgi:hypothetical protein
MLVWWGSRSKDDHLECQDRAWYRSIARGSVSSVIGVHRSVEGMARDAMIPHLGSRSEDGLDCTAQALFS